jgi:hypothetical protein
MRKLYTVLLTSVFLFSFYISPAQVLTFSFQGSNGDEASWPSATQGTGVQPSLIVRGPGVTAALADDGFNSSGWTTNASLNLNEYIEFTITPSSGYAITLSNVILQFRRSSKAPRDFVIRTSLDAYAADATNVVNRTDVNTLQVNTFTFISPITTSSPVTIRIYAYNAANTNNSWGPGTSTDGNDMLISGSFTTLPVKFVNVKAVLKNDRVQVSWTNATESDLLYYSVERSANAQSFTELTKINATRNDGGSANYLFTDEQPNAINFYRIKAIETTGHVVYSNIIKIEISTQSTGLNLYPNPAPAGSQIVMQMKNMTAGNYNVKVYSAMGQLINAQTIAINGGSLSQTVSLNNWQKGIYILEISGPVKLQKQFIIQ